jgi:catechol 2,3-dioxygenase-like lactoylglutathione lyase family enzyme
MSNSLFAVALNCADAPAQARFWADVLGRQVAEDSTAEHAVLPVDGDTSGRASRSTRCRSPKPSRTGCTWTWSPQRFQDETERLITLGAAPIRDIEEPVGCWTTFRPCG